MCPDWKGNGHVAIGRNKHNHERTVRIACFLTKVLRKYLKSDIFLC
jgi:hypothetical protein